MAAVDHWPLFGLRVRTPRLELRYPDDDALAALAELALRGVHDPGTMPFLQPWTEAPQDELPRNTLQFHWRCRAELTPADWHLELVVVVDGEVVGGQGAFAKDFAVVRTAETGSWLGIAHHGKGIGTEMRRAMLHLLFAGLGAEVAVTEAFDDNPSSLGVTRKLGYEPNGEDVRNRKDRAARLLRYRMTRASWEARLASDDVEIDGLEPCLPLLGAG